MGIVWSTLANKIPNIINLVYYRKMGIDPTFVLKLVSRSFRIQQCNLRSTLLSVSYFELWEK